MLMKIFPKTRSAFTLIELLVVIAIIAILAAILFPVFARARENARRSSCQSNLKQIGLGVMQYTQDYDERYPGYFYPSSNCYWVAQIQPYIKSAQVFQCPSESTAPGTLTGVGVAPQANVTDYFYNNALTSYNGPANAEVGINQAAVNNVALTIMNGDWKSSSMYDQLPTKAAPNSGHNCSGILGDTPVASGDCSDALALDRTAAVRHLEGANYAFADGHVKWYKPNSIYGEATPFATSQGSPTFRAKD